MGNFVDRVCLKCYNCGEKRYTTQYIVLSERILDSLTFVVKLLDVFVLLVKSLGVVMICATAVFFLRLLPKRIRSAVTVVATSLLFFALLRENIIGVSFAGLLRFNLKFIILWLHVASTLIVCLVLDMAHKTRIKSSTTARRVSVCRRQVDGFVLGAQYHSSYLRISPVRIQ